MQHSLTRLSSRFLPACRFILHPTGRFACRSVRLLNPRTEYWVGGVCSVLFNSRRNYIRGAERSGEIRNRNRNDAIALNTEIKNLGREGEWKEILRLAEKEKDRFDNVNWASAFSQLSRTRDLDRRDPLFESFVSEYVACVESRGLDWAGIRQVSNIVHVIGKMQLKNPSTKSILAFVLKKENARRMVEEGTPRDVSNVAWAFAKMNVRSVKLFAEIEARAEWLATTGSPQDVATVAWSFAKLDVRSLKIFTEIDKNADWLVTNGKPQDVVSVAWAFARVAAKPANLFAQIETQADWLVANGTPQHVANTAWACAKLGVQSPRLFSEVDKHAGWLVQEGTARDAATLAWACAQLGVQSPELFSEIEKHAGPLVQKAKAHEVGDIAEAFSNLGMPSTNFFAEVAGGNFAAKG